MSRTQRMVLGAVWALCGSIIAANALATLCVEPGRAAVAVIELRAVEVDGEALADPSPHTSDAEHRLVASGPNKIRLEFGEFSGEFEQEGTQ